MPPQLPFPTFIPTPGAASAVPLCQIHYGVPDNVCLPPGEHIEKGGEMSSEYATRRPSGTGDSPSPSTSAIVLKATSFLRGHGSLDIIRKLRIVVVMALFFCMTACPPQFRGRTTYRHPGFHQTFPRIQPLHEYLLMTDGLVAGEASMGTRVTFS
ncbi:hypothetical protein EV401DRAFT_1885144 [Pisolithus croceorrhizus]|nr:hypothetical protein EV401DRAFT_1885144 [Pisolithus croceorrhizus]